MGGGDLKDVTLLTSSAWRHRKDVVKELGDGIIEDFKQNMPPHIVLHWDGKVIVYEKQETDDRLCVKGSFPGIEKADQFFAAPAIDPPDGTAMKDDS